MIPNNSKNTVELRHGDILINLLNINCAGRHGYVEMTPGGYRVCKNSYCHYNGYYNSGADTEQRGWSLEKSLIFKREYDAFQLGIGCVKPHQLFLMVMWWEQYSNEFTLYKFLTKIQMNLHCVCRSLITIP